MILCKLKANKRDIKVHHNIKQTGHLEVALLHTVYHNPSGIVHIS